MKPYIDLHTQLRTKATTDFEKDVFKLMVNSCFEKTMENVRKRCNIRLASNQKSLKKLTIKPNFEHVTLFSENLVTLLMKKTELVFIKPVLFRYITFRFEQNIFV